MIRGGVGARLALVALLAALLLLPAGFAGAAGHAAGLIVRHGDGSLVYAYVPFAEDEISGFELLRRSGISLVTVEFGSLGEAACTIDGEGCGASECRTRLCQGSGPNAPYWRYFQETAPGEWLPFQLGASSAKVRPGDIHGWSWTGSDPMLPAVSMEQIIEQAGAGAEVAATGGAAPQAVFRAYDATGKPRGAATSSGPDAATLAGGIGLLVVIAGGAGWLALRARRGRAAA